MNILSSIEDDITLPDLYNFEQLSSNTTNLVYDKKTGKPYHVNAIEKFAIYNKDTDFTNQLMSLEEESPSPSRVLTNENIKNSLLVDSDEVPTNKMISSLHEIYEDNKNIFIVKELPDPALNTEPAPTFFISRDKRALKPSTSTHILPIPGTGPKLQKSLHTQSRTTNPVCSSSLTDSGKRIVCISDTHNRHNELIIPDGDILIHSGDFTEYGTAEEVISFNNWLGTLPHKHKVVVAGNHDSILATKPTAAEELLTNAHYLCDSEITLDKLRIYGTPWQPKLPGAGAFYLRRGGMLASRWSKIPEGIDILVTHTPPYGILDSLGNKTKVGCADLLQRVEIVKPKLHVYGHIHEGYGVKGNKHTAFINAANVGDKDSMRSPMVMQSCAFLWQRSATTLKTRLLSYAMTATKRAKL